MLKQLKYKQLRKETADSELPSIATLVSNPVRNYKIETKFVTNHQGILRVEFSFFGNTFSTMTVRQIGFKANVETLTIFKYESHIFEGYLEKYLHNLLSALDEDMEMENLELLVDFYNEVLENGIMLSEETFPYSPTVFINNKGE